MRLLTTAALMCCSFAAHAADGALIAPEHVRADLRMAREFIERTHPELAASLEASSAQAAAALTGPLTRDQAWAAMARLNPALADAHAVIGFDDWAAATRAHLDAGGGLFPFEVAIDSDGTPRILAWLGGQASLLAGTRIARLDGRDARAVVAELMERVHGDTPRFRTRLLGQRFWFMLWKMYGAQASFELALEALPPMRLPAARTEPALLRDEASFERQFQFKLLPRKAALLVLGSFSWPDKARYLAFTRAAFAMIRKEGSTTLVIDVRLNGGGNDDYWIEGVLRYIAGQRYRWASTFVRRVLEARPEPGREAGDFVNGEVTGWIEPALDEPLRFHGRVLVLTGDATYSSAILFANTVQDFGFATVAGPGKAVRARQSGGTQRIVLPWTGLTVSSPRFVLDRPSGLNLPVLFSPDLVVEDHLSNPDAMIKTVLDRLPSDRSDRAP